MTNSIEQLKSKISQRGGIARPNRFMIELPALAGVTSEEINILCRSANLPGKQILTGDRRIGMEFEKIAYGYAVEDVNMSFLMLKDYSLKKYFDAWRKSTINEDTHTASYKKDYQKKIVIHQLEEEVPSFHIGANFKINLPLGNNVNLPLNVKAGKDINIPKIPGVMMRNSVYSVELIDAFPTTVGGVNLNNDPDGLIELAVQFSYTNWRQNRPSQFSFQFGPIGDLLGIGGDFKFRDLAGKFLPEGGSNLLSNSFNLGNKFGIDIGGDFNIGF